jgi:hypothetical protein
VSVFWAKESGPQAPHLTFESFSLLMMTLSDVPVAEGGRTTAGEVDGCRASNRVDSVCAIDAELDWTATLRQKPDRLWVSPDKLRPAPTENSRRVL